MIIKEKKEKTRKNASTIPHSRNAVRIKKVEDFRRISIT